LRLYDFLSQIVPYNDPELEKLYAFGKNLMPRISEHTASSILELDSDVLLTHYRLQKLGESKLDLESGEAEKLKPVTEAGSSSTRSDEEKALKEIVERMNDLFAGDLTEADMVGYVTTVKGKLLENETLAEQAANNSPEQFELGDFKDAFEDAIVEGMDAHNNIAKQMLSDERIFTAMQSMMAAVVYKAFHQKQPPKPAASK
jgi:type I restriction enzyme R subunit